MGRTSQKFYLTEETTVKTTYEVEKIISFTPDMNRTICLQVVRIFYGKLTQKNTRAWYTPRYLIGKNSEDY